MAIIRDDPAFANDLNQAQLYAELLALAPIDTKGWRESRVIEVAAGCGGGLLYLQKHFCPWETVGIDCPVSPHGEAGGLESMSVKAT